MFTNGLCAASPIPPRSLILGQALRRSAAPICLWTGGSPTIFPRASFGGLILYRDPLPFGDKAFDFAYCRHVLEDLYNPFLLCTEMARVAMAGYIQTPSPLAEVCRGVDGNSPSWRGYQHHRFLIWDRNGILCFLSKYPIIEYVQFANEAAI